MNPTVEANRQHFTIARPKPDTLHGETDNAFWRRAACSETACPDWLAGWVTILPTTSDDPSMEQLNRRRADYIRHESGRRFTEERAGDALVKFTFPPGQQCFGREHWLPKDTEPLLARRQLGRQARLVTPGEFTDEFNEVAHRSNVLRARG